MNKTFYDLQKFTNATLRANSAGNIQASSGTSSTDATYSIWTGTGLTGTYNYPYIMSNTTTGTSTTGFAQTVNSGSWFDLSGSLTNSDVFVTGIGSIGASGSGEKAYIRVSNGNSTSGTFGEVTVVGSGATLGANNGTEGELNASINGAKVDVKMTLTNGKAVTVDGGANESKYQNPVFYVDSNTTAITLNSIDANQKWAIMNSTTGVLYSTNLATYKASNTATVTAGNGNNYLNFNIGTSGNDAVVVSATDSHTFSVNSTVIGASYGGVISDVKAQDKNNLVITKSGSTAGTLSAGGSVVGAGGYLSLGTAADSATVSANGGIVAVKNLTNGTWWGLGSTVASVGDETWTFSNKDNVTLNGGSTAGHVSAVGGMSGYATVVAQQTKGGTFGDYSYKIGTDDSIEGWAVSSTGTTETLIFDSSNNATISSTGDAFIKVSDGEGTLNAAVGTSKFIYDKLTLVDKGAVEVSGTSVVGAESIAAGTDWLVYGKGRTVNLGTTQVSLTNNVGTDSIAAAIQSKSADNAGVLGSIASLSGNVNIITHDSNGTANHESIEGLTIGNTTWTINNRNSADSITGITFDSLGAATVMAGIDTTESGALNVTGTDGANLFLTASNSVGAAYVNGQFANFTNDSNGAAFELETTGTNAGIKGISNFDKGAYATITGDNDFTVAVTKGSTYSFTNGATSDVDNRFYMTSDTKVGLVVTNLDEGANYNVTGGNVTFVANGAAATQTTNVNADTASTSTLTLNGTAVSITANAIGGASVSANDSDGIATISGVYTNSTIKTDSDKEFAVVFTNATSGSSVRSFNVNDISLTFDSTTSVPGTFTMNVNQTSDGNYVTIKSGDLGSSSLPAITASKGVYQVGSGAAVTINDDNGGYLYWSGNALTGEDMTVYNNRMAREEAAENASTLASSYSSVGGYAGFKNLSNLSPSSVTGGTVAGYEAGSTLATNESVDGGINIYGNTSLSAATSVTLQSDAEGGVNISTNEGASVKNAVIDFTGGDADLAIIGVNGTVSANHTVLASNAQSTVMFGANASGGSNMAKAGTGGAYLYNEGKKASLIGNSGNDTIWAQSGDFVEGGAEADYFYDSGNYTIRDYSVSDGDVLVVTQVSTSTGVKRNQISANQNVIQIGTGGAITLGTDYDDDEQSQRQVIINSDVGSSVNNQYIAWASPYGTDNIDVSEFVAGKKGALVLADENDNAADSVTGSANGDTIYAGANDTINAGAGADLIVLSTVSAGNDEGIKVSLSAGANTVEGWSYGFQNSEAGNSQLLATTTDYSDLKFKMKNGYLTLSDTSNRASVTFADQVSSDENYDILYGDTKIRFIQSGSNSTISSDDNVADFYTAEKNATLTFASGVESSLNINLSDSSQFVSISAVNVETEAVATVIGGSAKETVQVSGSLDNNAVKTVSLGGGNDVIISTGDDTDTAGNLLVFGSGDGKDTIQNFSYYQGADADPYGEAADTLYLTQYASLKASNRSIEISTTSSDKVVIARDSTDSTVSDDIMKLQIGNATATMKVGRYTTGGTSHANSFAYDSSVNLYYGNADANKDSLTVSTDENTEIWLSGEPSGKNYIGVNAIDASSATDANFTLIGSSGNNTLVGAGSGSYTTLWGADSGNNLINGGAGEDVLYYGGRSNDTVSGFTSDDVIWLGSLNITNTDYYTTSQIKFNFSEGGSLVVNSNNSGVKFRLTDNTEWSLNQTTGEWTQV